VILKNILAELLTTLCWHTILRVIILLLYFNIVIIRNGIKYKTNYYIENRNLRTNGDDEDDDVCVR